MKEINVKYIKEEGYQNFPISGAQGGINSQGKI